MILDERDGEIAKAKNTHTWKKADGDYGETARALYAAEDDGGL
jgi:hypothetical protein